MTKARESMIVQTRLYRVTAKQDGKLAYKGFVVADNVPEASKMFREWVMQHYTSHQDFQIIAKEISDGTLILCKSFDKQPTEVL